MCAQSCPTLCDPVDCDPVTHQVSLPMELSRQKYWSELPFPTPGDLSNPGIKPIKNACKCKRSRDMGSIPVYHGLDKVPHKINHHRFYST